MRDFKHCNSSQTFGTTIRFLKWATRLGPRPLILNHLKRFLRSFEDLKAFLDCKIRNIFFATWLSLLGSILLQNFPSNPNFYFLQKWGSCNSSVQTWIIIHNMQQMFLSVWKGSKTVKVECVSLWNFHFKNVLLLF